MAVELQDYLGVIRKRWVIILAVTLVTVGMAALYTAVTPRTYAATTRFFVSTSGDDTSSGLAQGNTFTQARVKSYSQLLETPKVLDPVIDRVGLAVTADTLADQITSSIPLDTVIIDVTVTSSSPESAQRIAAAVGDVFPRTIQTLESKGKEPSPVKVTLVQKATADPTPVNPRPTRNLLLGLVLGLLVGFGVALLRDTLDKSVKSQRDLEAVTDRTILGGIAFDGDAASHPLIVQLDPRSQRAEAFRSLRTNLQFVDVAHPPRSIVVTSSLQGEGKSTTTANLALSLAETGLKVVVLEGDLRRPKLLDYFGFEGSVGLTDVLVGRVRVDDVLQTFGHTSLQLLGAGPVPPNPSELLGSANMARLVETLTERFDYVLIDAPPLLPVTDAAVLSTIVDGALVVVGAGMAQREHVRRAISSLDAVGGTVLGLILNRVRAKESGYGYGTYEYYYRPDSEHPGSKGTRVRTRRRSTGSTTSQGSTGPTQPAGSAGSAGAVDGIGTAGPRPGRRHGIGGLDTDPPSNPGASREGLPPRAGDTTAVGATEGTPDHGYPAGDSAGHR